MNMLTYTQRELELGKIELKPLHLMYLLAIHQGDFDTRLHKGHFAQAEVFSQRIRELMEYGLITYNGRHSITPLGNGHVMRLMEQRIKPV